MLTGVAHSASVRQKLQAAGVPVVETWDITRTPLDMLVGFSHQKVGQAAARYLKQRGAQRPAVITPNDRRAQARAQAFVKAFGNSAGIPVIAANRPPGWATAGARWASCSIGIPTSTPCSAAPTSSRWAC